MHTHVGRNIFAPHASDQALRTLQACIALANLTANNPASCIEVAPSHHCNPSPTPTSLSSPPAQTQSNVDASEYSYASHSSPRPLQLPLLPFRSSAQVSNDLCARLLSGHIASFNALVRDCRYRSRRRAGWIRFLQPWTITWTPALCRSAPASVSET